MSRLTKNPGTLYLIPTLISENTIDVAIPPENITIIRKINYFLAENQRSARRFLKKIDPEIKIDQLDIRILDKRTRESEIGELMSPLRQGKDIGILSEAGSPGIADPGSLAVYFAHKNNLTVKPLVGPSSILLALMASGLNGQQFEFHGYLPVDEQNAARKIRELEMVSLKKGITQIFMETPYRNERLFKLLVRVCKKETSLCVARDITGEKEMIRTKPVRMWEKEKIDLKKVPAVFILQAIL